MTSKTELNDDQTDKLIDLYEERPCLWDISDKSYQKKDTREKSIAEISEQLDIDTAVVKSKWSSLRAQYGRELAKENKSKWTEH